MLGLSRLVDAGYLDSLSNRLRNRRFELFKRLVEPFPRPLRILDIGGTTEFWENRGWAGRDDVEITMININVQDSRYANITFKVGDATRMPEYADQSFNIVFSNSVIEHLFTSEKQMAMAREVCRVAKAYWIQTPNYWFPIEPHFHILGWQWLPEFVRVGILRRRTCGWRGRTTNPERAREIVTEVKLLTRAELRHMFPQAKIVAEKWFGLNKSWVVYSGFPETKVSGAGDSSFASQPA